MYSGSLSFYPVSLFLFQGAIPDSMVHLVISPPQAPLGCCFSHDQVRVVGFQEQEHKGKVPFLSFHTKGKHCQQDFSHLVLTLILYLAEAVAVRFPHCEVTLFVPFSALCSLERSCHAQPTLRTGELHSSSGATYLHK